jgi:hypothetical protein
MSAHDYDYRTRIDPINTHQTGHPDETAPRRRSSSMLSTDSRLDGIASPRTWTNRMPSVRVRASHDAQDPASLSSVPMPGRRGAGSGGPQRHAPPDGPPPGYAPHKPSGPHAVLPPPSRWSNNRHEQVRQMATMGEKEAITAAHLVNAVLNVEKTLAHMIEEQSRPSR